MNPNNTVFDAKRLIGRKFSDHTVKVHERNGSCGRQLTLYRYLFCWLNQEDMKLWPFKVLYTSSSAVFLELWFHVARCDRLCPLPATNR